MKQAPKQIQECFQWIELVLFSIDLALNRRWFVASFLLPESYLFSLFSLLKFLTCSGERAFFSFFGFPPPPLWELVQRFSFLWERVYCSCCFFHWWRSVPFSGNTCCRWADAFIPLPFSGQIAAHGWGQVASGEGTVLQIVMILNNSICWGFSCTLQTFRAPSVEKQATKTSLCSYDSADFGFWQCFLSLQYSWNLAHLDY